MDIVFEYGISRLSNCSTSFPNISTACSLSPTYTMSEWSHVPQPIIKSTNLTRRNINAVNTENYSSIRIRYTDTWSEWNHDISRHIVHIIQNTDNTGSLNSATQAKDYNTIHYCIFRNYFYSISDSISQNTLNYYIRNLYCCHYSARNRLSQNSVQAHFGIDIIHEALVHSDDKIWNISRNIPDGFLLRIICRHYNSST